MYSTVNVLLNIIYLNCGLINEEKIDIRSNELHLSSITFVYDEQNGNWEKHVHYQYH